MSSVEERRSPAAQTRRTGIHKRTGTGPAPLSFAQERLWFLDQLGLAGPAYNALVTQPLQGPVDAEALERSFVELIRRHESLRTRFEARDGVPVQIIEPPAPFELQVLDLSKLSEQERSLRAQRLKAEERSHPFNLARGQLIRATLLRLEGERYEIVLTLHHIVTDGWSMTVITRELTALYRALCAGKVPGLPPLPIQYADFASWQRERFQGDMLQRQLAHWRQSLAAIPDVLTLPTDRPRAAVENFQGAAQPFSIPAPLLERLRALAQREGATVYMVLLAAFSLLLARWSGQEDIVVGSPTAGRTQPALEGLIGFFVNVLAMRTDLSGNPTFAQLLSRVKKVVLGALAHQDIHFAKLVAEIDPRRALSHQPMFQVMLGVHNVPEDQPGTAQSVRLFGGENSWTVCDLTLDLFESQNGLRGAFQYATNLFDQATIVRLGEHFKRLLEEVTADASRQVRHLPLLTEAEWQRVQVQYSATQAPFPRHKLLHQLFEEQVARTPRALAVIARQSRLSYEELNSRANQLAHYLLRHGVGAERPIGLCVDRGVEMLVGLLGILKAGGAYLPLDPSYPQERLQYLLADANPSMVLTQARMMTRLPETAIPRLALDFQWQEIARYPEENPQDAAASMSPHQLAYIIYTSGSTGRPKGVMAEHLGAVSRLSAQSSIHPFAPSDICCQRTAIGFVDSIIETFAPLLAGLPLVTVPDAVANDIEQLASLIERQRITWLVAVPSLARALLDSVDAARRLRTLRTWTLSGEVLGAKLLQQLQEKLPECRFVNLYGASEVSPDATSYVSQRLVGEVVPIGQPITNVQVYVLDEYEQPVPTGVMGEIYVGGVGLTRGYLNLPAMTALRFVCDPFGHEGGSRLYRTGDLGRWRTDGLLEYLGRTDQQVKIRGHRIETGEVEAALLRHPGVRQAIVVAHAEHDDEMRLIGYVSGHKDIQLDRRELREHLRAILPQHMLPARILVLSEMPLKPNGKLDRQALPAPGLTGQAEGQYVAPRTPLEEAVSGIWRDLLNLERIGIEDEFFDLGGHSLMAIQVIARVRQVFEVELPLLALFEEPTIAGLSRRIEAALS